jgi:ethanolamine kinase
MGSPPSPSSSSTTTRTSTTSVNHALEYLAARDRCTLADDCVMIQGRPYLPWLAISDPLDTASVQKVVAAVLLHSTDFVDKTLLESFESWPVTPVTGGITNVLCRVDLLPSQQSILVRLFGAVGMIDRDAETSSLAVLADMKMAPPYIGRFQNGRLEGWMNNMRPLSVRELSNSNISIQIARQLARLHTECFVATDDTTESESSTRIPSLWTQLDDWCRQSLKATFSTEQNTLRARELQLAQYSNEITWLQDLLAKQANPPTIAYCHNDLLASNILYSVKDHQDDDSSDSHQQQTQDCTIQLIDFEYGGFNYAAFDIANHWNEYAGGTEQGTLPNYEWLPDASMQRAFVKAYLGQVQKSNEKLLATTSNDNGSRQTGSAKETLDVTIDDSQITTLLAQVHLFQLANHLYWGLWAVNQAASEGCCDFDYLQYASKRLERYQVLKQEQMGPRG